LKGLLHSLLAKRLDVSSTRSLGGASEHGQIYVRIQAHAPSVDGEELLTPIEIRQGDLYMPA
jgi:hypothetical protein